MKTEMTIDLSGQLDALRRAWEERRGRLQVILSRFDVTGMTRPARDPEERAWLEQRGETGPFVESEEAAAAARAYYRKRYTRP